MPGKENKNYGTSEWRNHAMEILDDGVPLVLVGTKSDLGSINQESMESLRRAGNFRKSYVTSSKTGEGVQEMFMEVTRMMIQYEENKLRRDTSKVDIMNSFKGSRSSCANC